MGLTVGNQSARLVSPNRVLGLWTAYSLVVGNVIGSGIFVSPGKVMAGTNSPLASLIVWFVLGIVTIFGN